MMYLRRCRRKSATASNSQSIRPNRRCSNFLYLGRQTGISKLFPVSAFVECRLLRDGAWDFPKTSLTPWFGGVDERKRASLVA